MRTGRRDKDILEKIVIIRTIIDSSKNIWRVRRLILYLMRMEMVVSSLKERRCNKVRTER